MELQATNFSSNNIANINNNNNANKIIDSIADLSGEATRMNYTVHTRDAKSGELGEEPARAIFPKSVLIRGQKGIFTLILGVLRKFQALVC